MKEMTSFPMLSVFLDWEGCKLQVRCSFPLVSLLGGTSPIFSAAPPSMVTRVMQRPMFLFVGLNLNWEALPCVSSNFIL